MKSRCPRQKGCSLLLGVVLFLASLAPLSAGGNTALESDFQPAERRSLEPAATTGIRYGVQVLRGAGGNAADLNSLGLRWVKFQVAWKDIEPNPGEYRWSNLDSMVNGYSDGGFSVVVSVVKAPDWARPAGDDRTVEGPPGNPATLARFISVMLQRACGRMRAVEVWNEQNLWYGGGGSPIPPTRYVQLLQASYQSAKAVDPNVVVISGAPTPTGPQAQINLACGRC